MGWTLGEASGESQEVMRPGVDDPVGASEAPVCPACNRNTFFTDTSTLQTALDHSRGGQQEPPAGAAGGRPAQPTGSPAGLVDSGPVESGAQAIKRRSGCESKQGRCYGRRPRGNGSYHSGEGFRALGTAGLPGFWTVPDGQRTCLPDTRLLEQSPALTTLFILQFLSCHGNQSPQTAAGLCPASGGLTAEI
ncbi:unnamed protein product [Boreogadus saida]